MDSAQLKAATRAQQSSLLAKIKERQGAVHAALVAKAKEELKALRTEARKAAGITGEDDEDDEDDEEEDAEVGEGGREGKTDGDGKGGALEVEGMVEKEEDAVAAAVAAEGEEEEEDDDEKQEGGEEVDSDFDMNGSGAKKGAARPADRESTSGESSGSDSDDSEVSAWPRYIKWPRRAGLWRKACRTSEEMREKSLLAIFLYSF